jgi:hypothetical protein
MGLAAGNTAPAIWRAFLFGVSLLLPGTALVPVRAANLPVKAPDLAQAGKAGPEEAARLLAQFRNSGIPGEYFLEFELRTLPRRGEEKVFQGKLWGGRVPQGALTRVELVDGTGRPHRLLVRNGERPAVWRATAQGVEQLTVAQLFEPLIPGVELTAFDVQMPFLCWPDATLEKISRTRGRPANAFFFRAPEAFVRQHGGVLAARAHLDTQFNALLQTELIGPDHRVVKTFSLLTFKTVDRQPLPKTADYRNELTRDKTRLVVLAAAVNLKLAPATFEPPTLARDAAVPPAGLIVSLD